MSKNFESQSKIALITKHAKADAIEPIFKEALGLSITSADALDTDTLSTFDNAVARELNPREIALKKRV